MLLQSETFNSFHSFMDQGLDSMVKVPSMTSVIVIEEGKFLFKNLHPLSLKMSLAPKPNVSTQFLRKGTEVCFMCLCFMWFNWG